MAGTQQAPAAGERGDPHHHLQDPETFRKASGPPDSTEIDSPAGESGAYLRIQKTETSLRFRGLPLFSLGPHKT